MENGNINKLPKWAQRRIRKLEADNISLKKEMRDRQYAFGTNVHIIHYGDSGAEYEPLPSDSRIIFGSIDKERFSVELDGDVLKIFADDVIMVMLPRAANHIYIK